MNKQQLFNYVPETLKGPPGSTLRVILEALANSDDATLKLLEEARKELFLSTASGTYLINLAASQGFSLPQNSGLDTVGFRKLAIPAISLPKQTTSTFNKVVEIFYATNILHPSFTAGKAEPYSLMDGDDIVFKTEAEEARIVFNASQLSNIASITAGELAGIINSRQNVVFADVFFDRTSAQNMLRITTRAFGAAARLSVSGGSAQNVFEFPSLKPTKGAAGLIWNITKTESYTDRVKFTWNGVSTDPKTFLLDTGDLVTIRGLVDVGLDQFSKLNGSYRILDATPDSFVISNLEYPHTVSTLTQPSDISFTFTSSDIRSLYNNKEFALVSETQIGSVSINIPAIPPLVRRDIKGSAHLHGAIYELKGIDKGSITVPFPNDFPDAGRFVIKSDRFNKHFNNRFFYYENKESPVGNIQKLLISNTQHQLPFLSAVDAASALVGISDPIYADLGGVDFTVTTPNVRHYFENAEEATIYGASLEPAGAIAAPNTIVVPGIPLPPNQNFAVFEHLANREDLYITFVDQGDDHEIYTFDYMPEPSDPLNKTRLFYGLEQEGRTIKAIAFLVNETLDPSIASVVVKPIALDPAGGTINIVHSLDSAYVAFRVLDVDNKPIWGVNRFVDNNTNSFQYAPVPTGTIVSALCIDFNKYQPVPGFADPNIAKKIVTGVTLNPSPVGYSYVDVTHALLTTSIVTELKLISGIFPYPMQMYAINNSQVRIRYSGNTEPVVLDVYIAYANDFPVVSSVAGGLLPGDINKAHVIKLVNNKTAYSFNIFNADGTIKKYLGSEVIAFDVEYHNDIKGNSDIKFTFPDEQSRISAGFITGTRVRLKDDGADLQIAAAYSLRNRDLSVQSQVGEHVYFKSGVASSPGKIISGAKCMRSGYFGGSAFSHYFNKDSLWNKKEFLINAKVISASAIISSNPAYVGSFIYDTRGDIATYVVSRVSTKLLQPIQAASSPEFLIVENVDEFIDGSFIFIDHGNNDIEGPIKVVNKVVGTPGQLVIDRSYVFKKQHDQGAIVRMLRYNTVVNLDQSGNFYPVYLTGVTAARNTVQKVLRDMAASGVSVNVSLQLPDIRYLDSSKNPFA